MSVAPDLWRIERPDAKAVPLIVNVPHAGTWLPPLIAEALTHASLQVPDTDWHVDELYDFAPALGTTLMVATHSRIVVDLNRNPTGDALYAGVSNTEICPTATFASQPIYKPGVAPDKVVIASRVERYWRPYHQQLLAEIARIKAVHGYCILLDAHSIISVAPRFFEGRLPDLNLGTADGRSCEVSLARLACEVLTHADGFTSVHNGRFKGGYITRHYGDPAGQVHALQLEMAQSCYLDEAAPARYDASRAAALKMVLKTLVERLLTWRPALGAIAKKIGS